MTDDLNATLRRWLELYSQTTPSADLPDWAELMQSLQLQGWQHLPDEQAELMAIMTQESVEFTRFAGMLMQQQEQPLLVSFFKDFHQHICRLTDDWILKRWLLPEQLGSIIKTRFWDRSSLDTSFNQLIQGLNNTSNLALPFFHQSALKELTKLFTEHQQAIQDYTEHYNQINSQALDHLSTLIEQSEEQISSLKQLHRYWVDAYEMSYAEKIATHEYQLAHGRISNSLMQIKLWLQTQRNHYLTQLGIASEASLNLAFEKIHQLSKQMRKLENLVEQTNQMSKELAEIKQQLGHSQENR